MKFLENRNILIGVTGGIAVYKVADIIRELKKNKANVKVIMTPFSERFVGKITFETLSHNKVYTDWKEDPLVHINLARWAEVFLIAPCTVNTLSKIANGIGDNLLTTTVLAYKGKLIIAPAANTVMYKNPVIQENIKKLKELGHIIVEPEFGILACEEEGEGKLAGKERIIDWIIYSLTPKTLKGVKVLITCGSTREYIDPVRYISNSSSGEMGFSLARVFRWKGAEVKVIAGFTTAEPPPEVEIERVKTAKEMYEAVMKSFKDFDIIVMNAAVSDFSPEKTENRKIKKREELILKLKKNPDILEELGKRKNGKFIVGFALESENLIENAKEKLKKKNADMIVANPVDVMGSKSHRGYIITHEAVEPFEFSTKLESAEFIVNKIESVWKG